MLACGSDAEVSAERRHSVDTEVADAGSGEAEPDAAQTSAEPTPSDAGASMGAQPPAATKSKAATPATKKPSQPVVAQPSAAATDSQQRAQTERAPGDADRGRSLLLNNGTEAVPYLSCGVPKSVVESLHAIGIEALGNNPRMPERLRGNAELPYQFSYAKTRAGVEVVTANCLLCHASQLGDSLVVGLGNPNMDFTKANSGLLGFSGIAEDLLRLALKPEERTELDRALRLNRAGADTERPDTIGLNPADAVFTVLAAHRDPETLVWRDERDPKADAHFDQVFTDVPPWWNMHRRERMFYNGFGRGTHARIMMTASLMCLDDVQEAEAIDAYFPDIEAYIKSLRPPRYEDVARRSIDMARAERGGKLYAENCTSCHGDSQQAPREDVLLQDVGTDPAYAVAGSVQGAGAVEYFFSFFNRSWYGTHGRSAQLERTQEPSYAAPPLVGVWATAPYFHNASVPTLEAVLDPTLRPNIYRRSTDPKTYDFERLGWPYEEVESKGDDISVYDATRPEYLNTGHTFSADFTADERRDLLEYLKTL